MNVLEQPYIEYKVTQHDVCSSIQCVFKYDAPVSTVNVVEFLKINPRGLLRIYLHGALIAFIM